MNLSVKLDINLTKIHIDGILHLAFVRCKIVGLNRWKDYEKYSIELKFSDGASLITEYSDCNKWKEVLKVIEDNLYP